MLLMACVMLLCMRVVVPVGADHVVDDVLLVLVVDTDHVLVTCMCVGFVSLHVVTYVVSEMIAVVCVFAGL